MEIQTSKGKEIKIPGPDHPITIFPAEGKVRVTVAGKTVAESERALRLEEKGHPPVYYSRCLCKPETTHTHVSGSA